MSKTDPCIVVKVAAKQVSNGITGGIEAQNEGNEGDTQKYKDEADKPLYEESNHVNTSRAAFVRGPIVKQQRKSRIVNEALLFQGKWHRRVKTTTFLKRNAMEIDFHVFYVTLATLSSKILEEMYIPSRI
jgi:hypothetical protein